MADDNDELQALEAIFCQPGELCISHGADGSRHVKVRLKTITSDAGKDQTTSLEADLSLMLPSIYPSKVPEVSVCSDQLSRKDTAQLRTVLSDKAAESIHQPMLMDLITLASEQLHSLAADLENKIHASGEDRKDVPLSSLSVVTDSEGENSRLVLMHLDHMRAKTQYVKQIKKWVGELALMGRLLFCQRLILILLQGPASVIKEYIVRQRTCSVDVDSRGQPCKERMLSVVCDIGLDQRFRFQDFDIEELKTGDDLKEFFTTRCLQDLYLDHVCTLKHVPAR